MTAALAALGDLARVAWHDATRGPRSRSADPAALERHLLEAEAWLCRAQDASTDGGVSYGYSWRGGWRPSYPETSGYIATTFLRLARDRDPAYGARAMRILDWLVSIQKPDGSFGNDRFGRDGIVFDTGQILFGLVAGFEASGDGRFVDAARRAAHWLTAVADGERRWTRHEFRDTPHVYNTRTAWALLCLDRIEPDAARLAVARANLDWAVASQRASGFFEHCAFRPGRPPFTHTIAYATRGLLESALLLDDPTWFEAAVRCARSTRALLRDDGFLPSRITVDGRPAAASCCLTGNAQFAIVWARLHAVRDDAMFRDGLIRASDYVMAQQDLCTDNPALRGAIKGSQPVWGRYSPLSCPNWAAKFLVDALWLRKTLGA